jgi:hypothetical protein
MKVLEIRPEQVLCEEGGTITTRPNSSYYSLKYFNYDNKRIAYTFSDTCFVQETYDARIFNCWNNGKRIQLRQDLSDRLATCIKNHHQFQMIKEYDELFKVAYEEEINWGVLALYLNSVEGLEKTKDGFVVYDELKIDFKGNAWTLRDDEWQSLCIVMQGHSYKADESKLPDKYGIMMNVNALTMTIISKIIFLLNIHLEDKVFTSQLSESLLTKLSKLKEVNE